MVSSTSGISFSGLFSGLDTESIIEQLLYIDSEPIRLLETKKTYLDYEKEALQEVNSSLLSLKDSIKEFSDGLLLNNKAVSDDEDVVTASATPAASPGVYTVSVTQMAQSHRMASDVIAGGVYNGNTEAFDITIAGETFTVNATNGQTLENIAQAINSSVSVPGGVDFMDVGLATVITVDPVTGDKRLVIDSVNDGTTNAMSFTDLGAAGSPMEWLGFNAGGVLNGANQLQQALDANVSINGVNIVADSNSIDWAVAGVTFNIQDFGTADVTVGLDDDEIVSQVQAFVDQFNTSTDLLAKYITEDIVDDPETAAEMKQGILRGDFDLASAKSYIRMKTTGYLDTSLADFHILSDIGIDSEASIGTYVSDNIELDESKLRTALTQDKEQVAELLNGFADQLDEYLESQTKVTMVETQAGNFYRRILNIDERQDDIDEDIETWEDRIANLEDRYRTQWSLMETYLQQLQSQNDYLTQQLSSLTTSNKD